MSDEGQPAARAWAGDLTLAHVLAATGAAASDVLVLRHTFSNADEWADTVTPARVMEYARQQDAKSSKFPRDPAQIWLNFAADGARRSRFIGAYVNRGEMVDERTAESRFFDLNHSDLLRTLIGRLVIEWSRDTINWAKSGGSAASFPVVEIADPEAVPFPGFDRVLVTYAELRAVVDDPRYAAWRTALSSVQGVYCIADTTSGRLYVGKADGKERLLGRWTTYARDGHGGNVAMRALIDSDPGHARHYMFSILRVFGPTVLGAEVDAAESHYKRALLTVPFGSNM